MAFKDWYSDPSYKLDSKKTSYWKNWRDWDDFGYEDPYSDLYAGIGKKDDEKDIAPKQRDVNKKICEDALRSISRSANVILNSGKESERLLTVKFSNGENKNTLSENVIYLSPDKLVTVSNRDDREEVIDSLCGQSMLAAQLKRQLDKDVYEKFLVEKDVDVKSLWSAIELAIARGDIISDWSGFKPYFDSYAEYSSKTNSTAIKRELSKFNGTSEDKPTNSKAFITGIAWNLYHSHDPVKIPPAYNAGKALIADALADADSCSKRWEFCKTVVNQLRAIYDKTPPPKPPKEDNPFQDPDDNPVDLTDLMKHIEKLNKNAEDGKKEEPPKKGVAKFTGVDEELFGSKLVDNKKCKAAAEIEAISGDSASDAKDSISAPGVPSMGRHKEKSLDRAVPFWVKKDAPSKGTEHHFNTSMLNQLDRIAETIKDSFGFTNVELKRRVFSQRSGYIHPESMYKINMDREDVFYKKSYTETDKVSVCLLIDQSGSMGCVGNYERGVAKVTEAAEAAYVIAKLCKDLKNLDLSVVGFSAQECCREALNKLGGSDHSTSTLASEVNMRLIYDSLDPANNDIKSICHIRAHANNLDGFSIWYAAKRMAETRPDRKRKIIIVVSDGSPNGREYGGDAATAHVNLCSKDAKNRFGVETYAIGISNAYPKQEGDKMYGAQNNIVISDIKSSVGYISRFLNQVSQSV